MGSVAVKASPTVSALLRAKRREARLSLREVSERLARQGERIPVSTLARIEQGAIDPGIRRLHRLLRLYDVPPHLVADLMELEDLAVDPPEGKDLETLYADGVRFWKEGQVGEGLAHLFALRQHVPADEQARYLRHKATLAFAVAARNLGKFKLARELVQELMCEANDSSILVEALILGASVWRGLGAIQVALALTRQAADLVEPEQTQKRAWVLHQMAKLLIDCRSLDRAERVLNRALRLYRQTGDTYGEGRARVLRAGLFDARGETDRAIDSIGDVLRLAERHGHRRLGTYGHLEHGRLLVKQGSPEEGLGALRTALGEAVMQADRNAEFLAHYWLAKAYTALEDRDRAIFELQAAKYFVRFIDDASPEADEIRGMLDG